METGESGTARKRLAKTRSRTAAAGKTGAVGEGEWLEAGEKAGETEEAEKGEA
ncbi:MAG: hypothetical protein LBU23_13180 [Planctomycetota bacterium]|jgi:hypothetical protein|nr:hypothetical protein [Planctomycetota bacterium]